jgi:hypothetical protein
LEPGPRIAPASRVGTKPKRTALIPAAAMPSTEATSPSDARTSPTNSLLIPMSA